MKRDKDRLEGSYKLAGLKRMERFAYVIQGIGIAVAFLLIMYLGGASIKPFYIPLFYPLLIALIWFLIVCIESFFFRHMEIQKRDSESAKFLMAHYSMKKAYTIIIIGVILLAILGTPFLADQIGEISSREGTVSIKSDDEKNIYFTSKGRFDYLRPEKIVVDITRYPEGIETPTLDVMVISQENYDKGALQYNLSHDKITPGSTFEYEVPRLKFDEYYIHLSSTHNLTVKYNIDRVLPRDRTFPFALLSLSFAVSYGILAVTLYPIKKKHSEEAIYR